ncbi:MAG: GGDEF domain-containing protein [Acidobacteria bacterium]|nr:GGDEF domain-containing protein [Acidobacteriota bacterium]
MTFPITNILNQELERILNAPGAALYDESQPARDKGVETIFRDCAAMRLAATEALRRYAKQMSKDELIGFQATLSERLDEWLSTKINNLIERRERALAEQSERDPVTALPNRAAFNRKLHDEFERARRYRRELSIVLFDVDGFKSVNDLFGHPAGDRILAQVASGLKSSLRQSDVVFRYGGDEFAAICPETPGDAIAHALRRLESSIPARRGASHLQEHWAEHPNISWGAASFPADAIEENEMIAIADERLYACKRAHRRIAAAGM